MLDYDDEDGRSKSRNTADEDKHDEIADQERRKKMMEGWSDKDKDLLQEAKNAAREKLEAMKKELNKNVGEGPQAAGGAGEALAFALYDGGDVKSRHNMIVR